MSFLKRNILFVDDDPTALTLISAMCGQAGYLVTCVSDGFEAIEMLHKYAFDLLILDIMMEKMNGLDLLKRLKSQPETKNIPVIMLSGRYDRQIITRAVQLGAEDYVVKPPEREKFLKKIEIILGGRPRFAEVYVDEDSKRAGTEYIFHGRVLSIGEAGMTFSSPIPIAVDSFCQVRSPIFKDIGIETDKFRVVFCQQEKSRHTVYVTFIGLKSSEMSAIREWVIGQALKGRTVA